MINREFEIIEGKLPVLISAPHVFPHRRPSIRGVLKQGEPRTELLVKEICASTNSFGIYAVKAIHDYDPNYNQIENNPYKENIKELFKSKKVKSFIDIHGLNDSHQYDFGIFYNMRYKKSKDMVYKLLKNLGQEKELKNLSYYVGYTVKNRQETLTEYVTEKLKFPALQLEIAKYIREDTVLLDAVVRAISKFVLEN